jgi:diadenosine tetraphosphate (Ap4A) HIT family hydrolase
MKKFQTDSRLAQSCIFLADWSLSSVYMKNEARYPWFILVPRVLDSHEIFELEPSDRQILMEEIHALSKLISKRFKPDKINVASLGNIVSQLHIHVVARFKTDPLWPQGIWQAGLEERQYAVKELRELLITLNEFILG